VGFLISSGGDDSRRIGRCPTLVGSMPGPVDDPLVLVSGAQRLGPAVGGLRKRVSLSSRHLASK